IPESKIKVVYLGVDPVFKPQPVSRIEELRKKYEIANEYILSVGTHEPRKNLKRVVRAFLQLNHKNLSLVIVGNRGWGSDITAQKNIKLLTGISEVELATLYSGAKCFVYPSLYEGFGLPVLEAMACATQVVTSNKGSLAEIVGPNAIVVDPFSEIAIFEGIKNAISLRGNDRKEMLERARRYVSKFTWEKTASETVKIYESIL
ncbi:MAG: glycosyltransferase family 1 protein, partial [Patescibacteria group bacterium]